MEWLWILLCAGWLISPIVLGVMLAVKESRRRKLENGLRRLYYSGRAALSELIEAGIDPKTVPREGGPIRIQPPVPQTAQPANGVQLLPPTVSRPAQQTADA